MANYSVSTLSTCAEKVNTDLVCLDNKMKERLGLCDTKLLCHIIAFLDTQTWQRKPNIQNSEQYSENENVDDNRG